MTIRKATYSELQKIWSYSLEVLKESTMGKVEQTQKKAQQIVSSFYADGGYYLVYLENHVILGWICVGRTIDYYTDEMVGIILELYVIEQYRKQGIAEKLCHEAFKYLKEEGYKKVQLNVFEGNHAKNLYQKLGFQDLATLMEKNLDDDL